MSGSGKKRNFTQQERSLLMTILKSYKNIIENKKTDSVNTAIKKRAWADIAVMYNTSAGISEQASGEQLRRLWLNLKSRHRALTRERQFRLANRDELCSDADADADGDGDGHPNIKETQPSFMLEISNTVDSDLLSLATTIDYDQAKTISEIENTQTSTSTMPEISQQPSNLVSPTYSPKIHPKYYSNNEKKLRAQILKTEYLTREKRAEEIHQLHIQHLKAKYHLETLILQQSLKEATAKAELAQENLCQDN